MISASCSFLPAPGYSLGKVELMMSMASQQGVPHGGCKYSAGGRTCCLHPRDPQRHWHCSVQHHHPTAALLERCCLPSFRCRALFGLQKHTCRHVLASVAPPHTHACISANDARMPAKPHMHLLVHAGMNVHSTISNMHMQQMHSYITTACSAPA